MCDGGRHKEGRRGFYMAWRRLEMLTCQHLVTKYNTWMDLKTFCTRSSHIWDDSPPRAVHKLGEEVLDFVDIIQDTWLVLTPGNANRK